MGRPAPADYSRGWQKILQQRSITRPLLKHKVGNCERILVWHEDGHLQLKYGSRIIYDSASYSSEKFTKFTVNNHWCWPPARSVSLVLIQSKI